MQKRLRQRGISRLELVVAVGLLAVIGGGGVLASRSSWARSGSSSDRLAAPLVAALSAWHDDRPSECPTLGLLETEGYLEPGTERADAWGTSFRVACSSGGLSLVSPGPDSRLGTSDDLRIIVR